MLSYESTGPSFLEAMSLGERDPLRYIFQKQIKVLMAYRACKMGPEASPPPGNPIPALSPQPGIPDDAFPQTSQRLTKQPSPVPLAFSSPNNPLSCPPTHCHYSLVSSSSAATPSLRTQGGLPGAAPASVGGNIRVCMLLSSFYTCDSTA